VTDDDEDVKRGDVIISRILYTGNLLGNFVIPRPYSTNPTNPERLQGGIEGSVFLWHSEGNSVDGCS
jgi:hypothetical protein